MMKSFCLWLSLGLITTSYAQKEFYVAESAAAGGDGSRGQPYSTLAQARDGIRAARQAGTLGNGEAVVVNVVPGIYRLGNSFELTAKDGGTAEAPVIYRSQANGQARVWGGLPLEAAAFKPVTEAAVRSRLEASVQDKVLVCDLSGQVAGDFPNFKTSFQGAPVAPWLYVNRQPMTLARWPNLSAPNAGWASFSKAIDTGLPQPESTDPALRQAHPGAFVFDDPRPARWNLAEGVWLMGYWTHDWSDEVIRAAAYDPAKKVITLAAPHGYGINSGTWGAAERRFFALNALEELDAPGEWYLDRARKLLYFYPEAGLRGAEIVLATLTEPMVRVKGAKHVKFQGFTFEYGHADGIDVENGEQVEIAGCTVANLAGGGIALQGTGNVARACDLYNLGRRGIALNGGDRQSLTPGRNLAENNHIHHFGRFQRTYAPGINVNGCGQIVRQNRIHDAPHNAILYGGNEHLFELNEVYRVVLETGDAGAFYTGRDWTSQGNILRNNYIHDLGGGDAKHVNTMGMYFDDCDCGDTIVGNVFLRAGRAIMIGGGRENPVLNNLVVDCPIGLHLDSRGMTWKQWNDASDASWALEDKAKRLHYTAPPWSVKYPRLAAIMQEAPREPVGNTMRRNVLVDCASEYCDFDDHVKKLLGKNELAGNLTVNTTGAAKGVAKAVTYKGFTHLAGSPEKPIDLPRADLLAPGAAERWRAWLRKALPAFEPIPFEKIGLQKDEYRRTLPVR